MGMWKTALALALAGLIFLTACGGGGGGGGATTPAPPVMPPPAPPPTGANVVAIVVDAGPAALASGPNPTFSANVAFASVTLCAPGTANCQTIDHMLVDTGSIGVRVYQSVLNPTLLAAMPMETDAGGNPVGECYDFADGFVFGSVRQADFQIGGEAVANMPVQVIGDGGAFAAVPSSCSAGGGPALATVQNFGANGIVGIGVSLTDCGAVCQSPGGSGAAAYYDCPASGCAALVTRTASTAAPFQQLPNPVAAMAVDNNGTIVSLPAVPSTGAPSVTGQLIFGIGTQANNALGGATVLTTTGAQSALGEGLLTVQYKGQALNQSFIDSGTNLYLFSDASIAACSGAGFAGDYCPGSPLALSPAVVGQNGVMASGSFTLLNARNLFSTQNSAVPGVGGNPAVINKGVDFSNSFNFGLPFFYGRNIYTALEGRNAGGAMGPYIAY